MMATLKHGGTSRGWRAHKRGDEAEFRSILRETSSPRGFVRGKAGEQEFLGDHKTPGFIGQDWVLVIWRAGDFGEQACG